MSQTWTSGIRHTASEIVRKLVTHPFSTRCQKGVRHTIVTLPDQQIVQISDSEGYCELLKTSATSSSRKWAIVIVLSQDRNKSLIEKETESINQYNTQHNNVQPQPIVYLIADVIDTPSAQIQLLFPSISDWVDKQLQDGRNILIHCHYGRSRSMTLTAAWMMRYFGLRDVDLLIEFLNHQRPCEYINQGFVRQLDWWSQHLGSPLTSMISNSFITDWSANDRSILQRAAVKYRRILNDYSLDVFILFLMSVGMISMIPQVQQIYTNFNKQR
jgi:protein-tyrosine phosphatase